MDSEQSSKVVRLTTSGGLVLRSYATPQEDAAYFKLQNENREHIAQFGNIIFDTEQAVQESHKKPDSIDLGIWKEDTLIGNACIAITDGSQAELGIWLAKTAEGHGYATDVFKAITKYAVSNYKRVFAEVDPTNARSIRLMQRVGYVTDGQIVARDWGKALVFELMQ